jgi:hypothetical protein
MRILYDLADMRSLLYAVKLSKPFIFSLSLLACSLRSLGMAQVRATMQLQLWLTKAQSNALEAGMGTTAFDVNKRPICFRTLDFKNSG